MTNEEIEHSHMMVDTVVQSKSKGVFARLIAARAEFQTMPIKKSGHNKFAGTVGSALDTRGDGEDRVPCTRSLSGRIMR